MAASTHCIRTIHSSFTTAAPHSSGAWASAASSSARTHAHSPSINSHNQFLYTHHLQNLSAPQLQLYADQPYAHHHHQRSAMGMGSNPRLQKAPSSATSLSAPTSAPSPSPSGAGGRRRSASIRMPPASYIKFDPFADDPLLPSAPPSSSCSSAPASEPTPADAPTPLTSSSQANRAAGHPRSAASSGPYTIQIPPAAPVEVQRYQQSYARRGHAEPLYIRLSPLGGGGGGGLSSSSSTSSSPSASSAAAKRFASKANTTVPSPQPRSAYAAPRTSCGPAALSGPNVSKLVAGILLNRVQQVRRPMRRRMPSPGAERREYVKSCLSSVVSIEA